MHFDCLEVLSTFAYAFETVQTTLSVDRLQPLSAENANSLIAAHTAKRVREV